MKFLFCACWLLPLTVLADDPAGTTDVDGAQEEKVIRIEPSEDPPAKDDLVIKVSGPAIISWDDWDPAENVYIYSTASHNPVVLNLPARLWNEREQLISRVDSNATVLVQFNSK